jgi:hypothetical protein
MEIADVAIRTWRITPMAPVDRRTFVGAAAALAAATALPSLALGQDTATPDAAGSGASPLAGLGLPELAVTVTNEGVTIGEGITAGTKLLTVANESEGFATFLLVQPPAEVTEDDVAATLDPNAPMPEWLHQATVTGSVDLEPGQSGEVGIELLAGDWYVVNVGDFASYATITVTGDFEEVAVDAAVAVVMHHHRFEIPAEVAAGPQVWQVTNEDDVLHHMIVFTYPEELVADQVLGLLMASEGMASPPAGLDPSLMMPAAMTGLQSLGVTNWFGFDFAPGFYQAVCFLADPGSETPHLIEGMIATFTVI